MPVAKRFVLASASPARRRLLADAGIDVDVVVSGVDESIVDTDDPTEMVRTLAQMKAEAVAVGTPDAIVLGCDSVLAFDNQILGKPADEDEARKRWYTMRGRSGVLYTGHCLINVATGCRVHGVATTTVHFADVSDAEIERYVASGEPLRVAGAFTIDGLGGPFVERISGDHGTVVGLSLPLLRRLLGELELRITDLWRPATQ